VPFNVPVTSNRPTAPRLSSACTGWAQTARFDIETQDGATVLQAQMRDRGAYRIAWRGPDRLDLTEIDSDDNERQLLFTANIDVIERALIGLLGDDIRDDLELPFLDLPTTAKEVASGYQLSEMVRGYRTLTRIGAGPVAAARDETLSLILLVPLSHFLTVSIDDLKRSFLNESGYPLLTR
jgi:hypothetical protein